MKKIVLVTALLATTQLSGCFSRVGADANEEVVLTAKPYFFGSGGIIEEPVTNGSAWVAWSTSAYRYKVTPQSYTVSFTDVISADNVPMDLSVTAIIAIKRGKTPELHEKFGKNWYDQKIERYFNMLARNFVRDVKHKALMNDKATITEGQERLLTELIAYVNKEGIPVDVQEVILGKATPPKELLVQIASTAAQTERIHTERQRELAEKIRKSAEKAKADADNIYQESMGFTPEQYLALRNIEIEKEKIEMVKEKDNVSIILTSGGGAIGTFKVGK